MKTNKTLMLAVTLSLLAMQPYAVFAAGADSFRTNEYKNIGDNVLDLINAADAYAQGYTGKGVTVGVADVGTVNFAHPEFSGKANNSVVYDNITTAEVPLTWVVIDHPTHVAGIVAANKDGNGMHGVAYGAGIASSSVMDYYFSNGSFNPAIGYYDYYLADPDIKIINNSWGANAYLADITSYDEFLDLQQELINSPSNFLDIQSAVNSDKLLVFAAGNSGHLTAGLESNIDVLFKDKTYSDNIITVTAAKANSFTKNEDSSFSAESDAIAIFSDLVMYNEDTSLTAPGWSINSTYSDFDTNGKYYECYSSTSMAAPMVTGVGALVQQAFPYLSGKQIGDVLLSTANKNIEAKKEYFITLQEDYLEDGTNLNFNIYFTGKASENINKWDILYEYYTENDDIFLDYFCNGDKNKFDEHFAGVKDAESLKNVLLDRFRQNYIFDENNITVYQNVPLDVLFGQGIVDAGSAVKGLGAINVRRLDKSDISSDYTVAGVEGNTEQALYKVDTQGYNSVWSNDISEIRAGYIAENPLGDTHIDFDGADSDIKDLHDRWVFYTTNNFDNNPVASDDHNWMTEYYMEQYNKQVVQSGLAGLHAGLYKTGEGVLSLTGNNTYKGASIAAGGTLQIDGRVAGDAYSEGAGTIAGSGTINGSLYNHGTVQAGSWGAVTDDKDKPLNLKVNGKFEGDGVIAVNTDGKYYAVINVGESADVSKMSLKAAEFAAPEVTGTFLTSNNVITVGNFNTDFSGLLNSKVENNGKGLTLTTSVNNNAGITGDRFNAINSLYDNLSADEQQEMYRLYALDSNELRGAMQNISASEGMHLELARDAMQNRDVRQAVTRQQHLDRDEAFWAISGKSWGDTDYGVNRHSFNLTLGRDF